MLKFATMAARFLALIVFFPVSGVVFWFALVYTVHQGAMAVPDLSGVTIEEARTVVHDLGMEVAIEDPGVFSASIPAGTVAVQRPHPGFQVKAGAKVIVRMSLGNERIEIPDLYGESLQSALRGLEQLGLPSRRTDRGRWLRRSGSDHRNRSPGAHRGSTRYQDRSPDQLEPP